MSMFDDNADGGGESIRAVGYLLVLAKFAGGSIRFVFVAELKPRFGKLKRDVVDVGMFWF